MSRSQIASACGCARSTVRDVLKRACEKGINWEDVCSCFNCACRQRRRLCSKRWPLCNQKCRVYDKKVIACEPTSATNELYRDVGTTYPVEASLPYGKN
ncbi:MAG: hypothetical protein IKF78_10640 [Atopobiaceae bacterium]|nr:hypothetical protein [Atopobiaceae bacterium]